MHFDPFLQGLKNDLIILQDDLFMAVIEEKPLVRGHCVVFPKQGVDSWTDLTEVQLSRILSFSKRVSDSIRETFPCVKVGMAALGLQVRHAHLHLVPLQIADDLNFTRDRIDLTREQLANDALSIREAFNP